MRDWGKTWDELELELERSRERCEELERDLAAANGLLMASDLAKSALKDALRELLDQNGVLSHEEKWKQRSRLTSLVVDESHCKHIALDHDDDGCGWLDCYCKWDGES